MDCPIPGYSRNPFVVHCVEYRVRAKREQLATFYWLLPEDQGQNQAMTVFSVTSSLRERERTRERESHQMSRTGLHASCRARERLLRERHLVRGIVKSVRSRTSFISSPLWTP